MVGWGGVGEERVCHVLKLQLLFGWWNLSLQQEIVKRTLKVINYDENIDFVLFSIFVDLYRGARDLSISANNF
jgi:hypothetical protein